ncbi:TIR domain-containing adapter molecule 2 [Rhineura floridana]|uniref:TIR domain-containing adapter molecule 2 n=1 Tax=Rhineura floridana TaxID=261503 RepID=UPI002AC88AE1|nr:TIR domain-containing adapter molecule 2 [Rhineura floridana]XP_061480380.1 TIR domain-containing adapter molecule 2 [Rhineura floridana]XP_061480389.1 TIR domain-containing adapter molecule 2 [Rhineura floridana]XP_061480397.1 TIR domain-containing adapter molecule 2 [Rhineura floridana]XP_061480404.1 TIR domain-containing adapter molecule 2 [Rhineura floridana]XP_061480412.1 TIR domain-containing adapter molecule 2 [Rhineura floridana]XP_061480421.1 TIR domain-containing adapter molecule
MGNDNSKRTSPFPPRNSVKDNCRSTGQKGFKQKLKRCELSLSVETSGYVNSQEIHSSDEDAGDTFYRFVILHAEDDVEEAVRVQDLLQNEFCIKPGIIFAEMPSGRHLLENLNDAMNGSAWTIILLTENFLSELWCEFQSYTSLFSALTMPHKGNTVIPMRPRNNPLPRDRTPFILQSINALQEDSPGFAQQVKKTFEESRYRQQLEIWRYEKKKREAQKLLKW